MKILIVSEWYSDGMGYAENYLPEALGELGHEVHLVTSNLQVYANLHYYDTTYKSELGNKITEVGIFKKNNYLLHRNKHKISTFGITIVGLKEKIADIKPDIVYCFEINDPSTILLARLKKKFNYYLFSESRLHDSILSRGLIDRLKFFIRNLFFKTTGTIKKIDMFYPIAPDVFSNILKYYCVPFSKCKLSSLGVNTSIFNRKENSDQIKEFRQSLGFKNGDLVCLYTGKFSDSKGPIILAKAVESLQQNGFKNIKALFVGDGQLDYKNSIASCEGCVIIPFVSHGELPKIYQSADIGVWPLQESTSQLDAMACVLPLILNDLLKDKIRFEESALLFKINDVEDLANKILILRDANKRKLMAEIGSRRVIDNHSWGSLAMDKISDFQRHTNLL